MPSLEPGQAPRLAHRLPRWQRLGVNACGALMLLTGTAWLALHYSIGAGAGELPHPLEVWCLRAHGLGAFASLFMFGVLAAAHVPQGWRLSERRGWAHQQSSGTWLCIIGASLVLSGYLLFYFAPENLRPSIGWAHSAIGGMMAALVVGHRRGA